MMPYGSSWEEELNLLFAALPPRIASAAQRLSQGRGDLLEVVLDLGREPEARFTDGEAILDSANVGNAEIDYVTEHVGLFGDDNRAGIERTLHRISAIRNREGTIVGLTCRVGRAVTGTIDIIKDMVISGQSILLLGPPGIGKTTMLRECARVLSDECGKRVVIVDTSNEIAGDGDIPHPGIGRSRRMQVRTPALQHAVMIEAVENHMPQCIVIDEIGTELEAVAARTIAERGVQLVGTAHGSNIDSLLVNPTLNDLLGGIQTVTLSRRGGAAPRHAEVGARAQVAADVRRAHRDPGARPRGRARAACRDRRRGAAREGPAAPAAHSRRGRARSSAASTRARPQPARRRSSPRRSRAARAVREADTRAPAAFRRRRVHRRAAATRARVGAARRRRRSRVRTGPPLSIFPYGVSRSYLEQSLREMRLPVRIQHHVDDADLVLTLEELLPAPRFPGARRRVVGHPDPCAAQQHGRADQGRARSRLRRRSAAETPDDTEPAMQDVLEGIEQMQRTGNDVELTPQNSYVRRLQHQLVEQHALTARSTGDEPNRRLVILRPSE